MIFVLIQSSVQVHVRVFTDSRTLYEVHTRVQKRIRREINEIEKLLTWSIFQIKVPSALTNCTELTLCFNSTSIICTVLS